MKWLRLFFLLTLSLRPNVSTAAPEEKIVGTWEITFNWDGEIDSAGKFRIQLKPGGECSVTESKQPDCHWYSEKEGILITWADPVVYAGRFWNGYHNIKSGVNVNDAGQHGIWSAEKKD